MQGSYRRGGAYPLGNVGPGGDVAAARHGAAADLEDRTGASPPLDRVGQAVDEAFQLLRDEILDLAGPVLAPLSAEAENRLERHSGLAEVGRQVEQVEKSAGSSRPGAGPCRTR